MVFFGETLNDNRWDIPIEIRWKSRGVVWCFPPAIRKMTRKKGGFQFIGLGSDGDLNMGRFGDFTKTLHKWMVDFNGMNVLEYHDYHGTSARHLFSLLVK